MVKPTVFFKKCAICGSTNVSIVNTYKHYWRVCNDCGTAFSKVKNHFSLSFLPFATLKKNKDAVENPENLYNYADPSEDKIRQDEELALLFSDIWMNLCKINLKGKKFLEISGGTGHFINALRKFGVSVFHTEYDRNAGEYVNNKLMIKSKRFDFNKDRLQDLFSEKFDIILLKGAIEFCTDVNTFLSGIEGNTHSNTVIIVITAVPTLGNFLLTQFDDYNQQVLYQPQTLVSIFKEHNYSLLWKRNRGDTRNRYPLFWYRHKWARLVMLQYMIPAMYKLSSDERFLFHALSIRGVHLIFEKGEHAPITEFTEYY